MALLRDFSKIVMPIALQHMNTVTSVARGFQLLYEALRLSRYALEYAGDDACHALAAVVSWWVVCRLSCYLRILVHWATCMPSVWRGAALARH